MCLILFFFFSVICRKISEKKNEKLRVFVGTGQEKGPIEDGHCWRKYGQKEIHGSKNPR